MIEKKPFVKYKLGRSDKEVIAIKMNNEEMKWLMHGAIIIKQTKKSTALKNLAKIGHAKVLFDTELCDIVHNNLRKNRRTGVNELEQDIIKSWQK